MLSLHAKTEFFLIFEDNRPYRQVAKIFNNRHPETNIHFSTVAKNTVLKEGVLQKFYE